MLKTLLLTLCLLQSFLHLVAPQEEIFQISFLSSNSSSAWEASPFEGFKKSPSLSEWSALINHGARLSVSDLEFLLKQVNQFRNWFFHETLDQKCWLYRKDVSPYFKPSLSTDRYLMSKFIPFTQKVLLSLGSRISVWGDIHGSISGFSDSLQHLISQQCLDDDFKVPNHCFLIFLGDFIDRGP
eukprot:Sdes_comp17432_c0_seq2m6655